VCLLSLPLNTDVEMSDGGNGRSKSLLKPLGSIVKKVQLHLKISKDKRKARKKGSFLLRSRDIETFYLVSHAVLLSVQTKLVRAPKVLIVHAWVATYMLKSVYLVAMNSKQ
jgi:hypothetical protein